MCGHRLHFLVIKTAPSGSTSSPGALAHPEGCSRHRDIKKTGKWSKAVEWSRVVDTSRDKGGTQSQAVETTHRPWGKRNHREQQSCGPCYNCVHQCWANPNKEVADTNGLTIDNSLRIGSQRNWSPREDLKLMENLTDVLCSFVCSILV